MIWEVFRREIVGHVHACIALDSMKKWWSLELMLMYLRSVWFVAFAGLFKRFWICFFWKQPPQLQPPPLPQQWLRPCMMIDLSEKKATACHFWTYSTVSRDSLVQNSGDISPLNIRTTSTIPKTLPWNQHLRPPINKLSDTITDGSPHAHLGVGLLPQRCRLHVSNKRIASPRAEQKTIQTQRLKAFMSTVCGSYY